MTNKALRDAIDAVNVLVSWMNERTLISKFKYDEVVAYKMVANLPQLIKAAERALDGGDKLDAVETGAVFRDCTMRDTKWIKGYFEKYGLIIHMKENLTEQGDKG